jgi:hypothetical protein
MKPKPKLDLDFELPITPLALATAVWEEAIELLGEPLPEELIQMAAACVEAVYQENPQYRCKPRGGSASRRNKLWRVMRNWLTLVISRYRPDISSRLFATYELGRRLSAKEAALAVHVGRAMEITLAERMRFLGRRPQRSNRRAGSPVRRGIRLSGNRRRRSTGRGF